MNMDFQVAVKSKLDYSIKLIGPHEIGWLRDAGYKVIDLHLHTSFSSDVIPAPQMHPVNLYHYLVENGWDYVTFTDHDTLDAYDEFDTLPNNIIRGVEIKIKPIKIGHYVDAHTLHVNVFCLNHKQFSDLKIIAETGLFYEFKNYLDSNDLPYQLNHPTWCEFKDKPDWRYLPDVIKEFDVIEVCNYKRSIKHNYIALKLLAEEYCKGIVGGSDSHTGEPIKATFIKGENFREGWDRIKAGESFMLEQANCNTLNKQELIKILTQLRNINPSDLENNGIQYNLGPVTSRIVNHLIASFIRGPRFFSKTYEIVLYSVIHMAGDYILKKAFLDKDDKSANYIYKLFCHQPDIISFNSGQLVFN